MRVKDLLKVLEGLDPEMFVEIPFDTEGLGGHAEPTWVGIDTRFGDSLLLTNGCGNRQPDEMPVVLWTSKK